MGILSNGEENPVDDSSGKSTRPTARLASGVATGLAAGAGIQGGKKRREEMKAAGEKRKAEKALKADTKAASKFEGTSAGASPLPSKFVVDGVV